MLDGVKSFVLSTFELADKDGGKPSIVNIFNFVSFLVLDNETFLISFLNLAISF